MLDRGWVFFLRRCDIVMDFDLQDFKHRLSDYGFRKGEIQTILFCLDKSKKKRGGV